MSIELTYRDENGSIWSEYYYDEPFIVPPLVGDTIDCFHPTHKDDDMVDSHPFGEERFRITERRHRTSTALELILEKISEISPY